MLIKVDCPQDFGVVFRGLLGDLEPNRGFGGHLRGRCANLVDSLQQPVQGYKFVARTGSRLQEKQVSASWQILVGSGRPNDARGLTKCLAVHCVGIFESLGVPLVAPCRTGKNSRSILRAAAVLMTRRTRPTRYETTL
jgi:hypothetical protein